MDTRLPSGVAKIEAKSSVRIRGQAGETILLTSEEFSDNGSAHIIKRNRRGQFNYRRWSVGPSAKRSGEIRGVISIEAL
ncbi:MAG: hypothetical protein GY811_17860 [Myxococcales bacterium]|nr:hypothetical protein [Myxococcales bacterium]